MSNERQNEDARLIEGCKSNNATAQKRLFEKYYAMMLGVCLRYTNNREDARDILQEGFTKVFLNIERYKADVPVKNWISTIMINTAIDKYRKDKRTPENTDLVESDHQQNLDSEMMGHFNAEDLLKLIDTLPSGAKKVFNLFVIEGYKHKEIGKLLGFSEATSRSQLDYARKLLRKKISQQIKSENK